MTPTTSQPDTISRSALYACPVCPATWYGTHITADGLTPTHRQIPPDHQVLCPGSRMLARRRHSPVRQAQRNAARRARHQAMLDLGLVRVKGALGGTYYE